MRPSILAPDLAAVLQYLHNPTPAWWRVGAEPVWFLPKGSLMSAAFGQDGYVTLEIADCVGEEA